MDSEINPFFVSMLASITRAAEACKVKVDTLLRLIGGESVASKLIQPELIVRESCARVSRRSFDRLDSAN